MILSLHIRLCRFLLRYLYIRPISRTSAVVCVCSSVRRSQGDVARRHESSRVLFVTLHKSETYKETIVRVPRTVPSYSYRNNIKTRTAIAYGVQYSTRTVQIMLCGGLGAMTPRFRDFCGCYPAYLILQYPYIRPISRGCLRVCDSYSTVVATVLYAARDPGAHKCITGTSIICPPEGPLDTVVSEVEVVMGACCFLAASLLETSCPSRVGAVTSSADLDRRAAQTTQHYIAHFHPRHCVLVRSCSRARGATTERRSEET